MTRATQSCACAPQRGNEAEVKELALAGEGRVPEGQFIDFFYSASPYSLSGVSLDSS